MNRFLLLLTSELAEQIYSDVNASRASSEIIPEFELEHDGIRIVSVRMLKIRLRTMIWHEGSKRMIDNTDKNINNDEFSDILDSIRHIQVFDDELGVSLPFMQMDCFVCKNEQSMIMLLDDQGKICYDNFYCRTCNVGNATKDSMKRYIVTFRKIINSLLKFPDETFAAKNRRDERVST